MYLKRLEIQGFKSFAKLTVLEFEPGITSIVGPNGSGKSNVADAVRWVLGEQSKLLLRGKKAEDVIFAGSASRPKGSLASVSVVFDNKDSKLPFDSAEVVFTRKLHGNGESEYLINNQPSRLMDITDALTHAGFAPSRYTVIGQGTIDQFLLQGPGEIKALVEEAAGIAPLKLKREKTVRRLQVTEENLNQVSALIAEIEPRLRTLRRQAKKLEARAQIENQWRELLSGRLSYVFSKLEGDKSGLEASINNLDDQIKILEKIVQEYFKKVEESVGSSSKEGKELSELQTKISEEQKRKEKLQITLIEIRNKIILQSGSQKSDLSALQAEINRLENESKEFAGQISELDKNIKDAQRDIDEIVAILNSARPDLVPKFNSIADKFLNTQRQFFNRISEQKKDMDALLNRRRAEVSAARGEDGGQSALRELEDKTLKDIGHKESQIKSWQDELQQKLSQISEQAFERQTADKKIRQQENHLNTLRNEQSNLRIELARIETHLEEETRKAIESLGSNWRDVVKQAKAINEPNVEEEIVRLKKQLEMIGGLDEMTLQEYEETEERYGYLTGQVKDLENAAKDLAVILEELDKVIKDRFHQAFIIISDKFGNYFRLLFNGGRGGLYLIKEEPKPEEGEEEIAAELRPKAAEVVGIEVRATPAGKKLSSIAALSGGERSLTSIALLMAMLDAYPSPFVVLDEVDAALDESNSIRFAKILGELADRTQFVAITHNRETMRRAHTLYGVTMGQDGVSQILSIKLDQSFQYAKE